MMRVELVEHNPPAHMTGIRRYTLMLAQHLQAYTDQLEVRFARTTAPPLARRFSSLHHLPLGIAPHHTGSIAHFQQIMGCAVMLWQPPRPAIATVHDLGGLVWREEWQNTDALSRALLRLSLHGLRRVDALIADSEFTRQSIIEHLRVAPERVHTIHIGIDHTHFRPIANARQQLARYYPLLANPQVRYLLYVGTELPRKNIATLLEIVALLRQHHPDLVLLKVGKAGGAAYRQQTLQTVQRFQLAAAVHLLDAVPDEHLPLFYSAAAVYVQPSLLEGFGLPVLEALACGTPVVHAQAGALPEVTATAAHSYAPTDAAHAAHHIHQILTQPALRQLLRQQGLARAAGFTWQRTALATLGVYRRVAADYPPPPATPPC